MAPMVFLSLRTVLTLFFFQEAHPSGNLGNLDNQGKLNKHKHTPHNISLCLALTHRLCSHIACGEWTVWNGLVGSFDLAGCTYYVAVYRLLNARLVCVELAALLQVMIIMEKPK